MEFVNPEKFEKILRKLLNEKALKSFNLQMYLDDLTDQFADNGCNVYQLNENDTKSGKAEVIRYKLKVVEDDGEIFVITF